MKKNKIQELADYFKITVAELSSKCGYDRPQAFYDVLNGKTKTISEKMANKIVNKFPAISYVWLLTGEGEMLTDKNTNNNTDNNTDDDVMISVPLLPVSAIGGSLNDFIVSVKDKDCERIISPIKNIDYALTVSGESMQPEFPNGCKVLIKKVDEKIFIEWGKVYVLDTPNGVVIKVLQPTEKDDEVLCVSLNQDQKRYAPFRVQLNNVFGVYRVVMMLSER